MRPALLVAFALSLLSHAHAQGDGSFASQIAKVKALLVMPLDGGDEAGTASTLAATAVRAEGETTFGFNQQVGPDMESALREVLRFHQLRHRQLPSGFNVQLAFSEQYSPKDGPSAAVACALLLESLISGDELDQSFAVTGDMNADGSVQPISGVSAKIRGATRGGSTLVAIPLENRRRALDLYLDAGPAPFLAVQAFTIDSFDQALALALGAKPAEIQESIDTFSQIQAALANQPNPSAVLRNQAVKDRLALALQKAPNHLSAALLLADASGRLPKTLTLRGSLEALDRATASVIGAIDQDLTATSTLDRGRIAAASSDLSRLRPKIDPRTRPYADSLEDFSKILSDGVARPPTTQRADVELSQRLAMAIRRVQAEEKKLQDNPAIREELMQD